MFCFLWILTNKERFEDTKGVIRSRKSEDRQYNGQKKKYKRRNNDLHNITQKIKDQATRTTLKLSSCATCDTRPVTLVANSDDKS